MSRNSWNLLSFTGLETSLTRGPEKLVVSSVIKEIIDDVIIGLNFLNLLGEKRALRLRTATSGQ